jgi:hypothetical protein
VVNAAGVSAIRLPMYHDGQPFTRRFAIAHGWTDRRLAQLVREGLLRRLVKSVYVDALAPDTLELRASAVALVAPKDSVICRQTAAWIYGVAALALRTSEHLHRIDCVQPPKRRASRLSITSGHSQTLLPADVVEIGELRVTSPVATAIHLARHLDRPFALSAVDAMLHANLVTDPELRAAAARYPHHPGIVQAREIISFADPLTESPGESWLRLRLLDAGFGRPTAQVPVRGRHRNFRIDLGYPKPMVDGRRLGLEYDSDEWHSGPSNDLRDELRRQELADVGWHILSVRRTDVWGQYPELELAVGSLLGMHPRLPRRW